MNWPWRMRNRKTDACCGRPVCRLWILPFLLVIASATPASARDASFIDPGSAAGAGVGDDAVKVEPKGDIDVGDSVLGVARRVDLFFVNQSGTPVKVEKVTVNGDGNVATEIATDDCSKQGLIPPGSRCSVEASITPSSPGAWSAEVLLTHDGAGRIARGRLTGKTAGTVAGEKKDMGLALNTKEASPVNFGEVEIGDGKVVRSALMVNDSAEPITLYSIDVIEASDGLKKLDQGCAVDMELKPGESCPVTLVWTPASPGQVSTDLIIRHSGRLGFAVIPIRGVAKGIATVDDGKNKTSTTSSNGATAGAKSSSGIPSPPTPSDIVKAAGEKIAPVSTNTLDAAAHHAASSDDITLYLIGTVGNRAVILKPDGKTTVASAGDEIDVDATQIKVLMVGAKSIDVTIGGKKKTINLGSAPDLVARATVSAKTRESAKPSESGSPPTGAMTTPASASAPVTSSATTPMTAATAISGAPK